MNKPSPEAKALSLFLMAHNKTNPSFKEKAKHINKQWDQVVAGDLSKSVYMEEVQKTLASFGGYSDVVTKTVQFYINTTGEWKLKGDDKYCLDAQKIADDIMKLRKS